MASSVPMSIGATVSSGVLGLPGPKPRRAMELRPLGFGEIFDRAVTLYIKNFVPFAAIVLVLIVPLGIFQYVLDASAQPSFDAILQALQHPGRAPTQQVPSFLTSPLSIAVFIATL